MSEAAPFSGTVTVDGVRIGYDSYGAGRDTVVLLPALLMSRRMQEPLAQSLALREIRTITLDYLGDRDDGLPHEPSRFTSDRLAAQTLAAMEQLGIERAVIGGTSIGSNIALEAAIAAPERFTGLLIEGPFLDRAAYATALGFSAMFGAVTVGRPLLRAISAAARLPAVTRAAGRIGRLGVPSSLVLQDPVRAAAFLQGLLFGRIGPPRDSRGAAALPTLVIGFPLDPFHPMSDAADVADQLPNARLVRASSIAELRFRPERRAGEIARFIGDCRRAAERGHNKEAVA
jgi:pimeloyl-ACP methyl ester carboxylesterase